jgi:hypothetical protein
MPRIDLKTITLAAGLGSALLLAPVAAQAQMKPVLPKAGQPADTVGGGMGIRSGDGAPARGPGMLERRHRGKHVNRSHRTGTKAAQGVRSTQGSAAKKVPSTETTGTTVQPGSMGPAVPANPGLSSPPGASMSGDKAPPTVPNSATEKTTQP